MVNWNLISKIAGGTTAGLVLYNAHTVGKRASNENVKNCTGKRMTSYYMSSRRMEDLSPTTSGLKDFYFRTNADWNLPDKFNAFTGYISGAFKQVASDIIPAVLATGALLSKGASKWFGLGLGIYAIKYLICDVMDIGRINHLK